MPHLFEYYAPLNESYAFLEEARKRKKKFIGILCSCIIFSFFVQVKKATVLLSVIDRVHKY
jgi:hypothetical protein